MPDSRSPETAPSLLLLIDHDNVPFDRVSFRDLLFVWIDTISGQLEAGLNHVQVRAYGGWFNGNIATDSRFRAAEFYPVRLTRWSASFLIWR